MNTDYTGSLNRQNTTEENGGKSIRHSSKYAIFLSAAVYPGAGQMLQKRWLAGIFFAVSFTVMFIAFIIIMGGIIMEFYSLGFDFSNSQVNPDTPTGDAISAFVATLIIYIINIIDAHAAYRRTLNN